MKLWAHLILLLLAQLACRDADSQVVPIGPHKYPFDVPLFIRKKVYSQEYMARNKYFKFDSLLSPSRSMVVYDSCTFNKGTFFDFENFPGVAFHYSMYLVKPQKLVQSFILGCFQLKKVNKNLQETA
ncbi:MAG: hypothetical protein ACLQQ4_10235 [Bacteroidia bacterium]